MVLCHSINEGRMGGHSNPTCSNEICLNFLHSEVVGIIKHRSHACSRPRATCQTFTIYTGNRLVFCTDTEPRTELHLVGEPGGVLAREAARRSRHAVCHHSTEDYTGTGALQNDTSQPLQYHSESCSFSHSFSDTYSIRLSMVS